MDLKQKENDSLGYIGVFESAVMTSGNYIHPLVWQDKCLNNGLIHVYGFSRIIIYYPLPSPKKVVGARGR